jgi:hypothetical protein
MSRRPLLFSALVIALLPACKDQQPEEGQGKDAAAVEAGKAPSPEPQPVQPEIERPEEAGAAEAEAEADDEEAAEQPPVPEQFEAVGVDSCDKYVASYVACIDEKVPEAEREAQRRIVFDNVSAWKQTAAGGGAAEKGLQTACKIATEQAKRATQDWDCAW